MRAAEQRIIETETSKGYLGIPGAPQAAVLYGALILQGLRPGAELYTGRGAVITYTFILSLFLANIMMFIIGISASRYYARALKLPNYLLMPIVLSLSVVGAFASRNSIFDVAVMLLLGLIAFAGTKVALSPAPIALGVILGPIIERGLVESIRSFQIGRTLYPDPNAASEPSRMPMTFNAGSMVM